MGNRVRDLEPLVLGQTQAVVAPSWVAGMPVRATISASHPRRQGIRWGFAVPPALRHCNKTQGELRKICSGAYSWLQTHPVGSDGRTCAIAWVQDNHKRGIEVSSCLASLQEGSTVTKGRGGVERCGLNSSRSDDSGCLLIAARLKASRE